MRQAQDRVVCPFLQDNEPRCGRRFTLEHMSEVFEFCLHEHRRCTIYHELCVRVEQNARVPLRQAG